MSQTIPIFNQKIKLLTENRLMRNLRTRAFLNNLESEMSKPIEASIALNFEQILPFRHLKSALIAMEHTPHIFADELGGMTAVDFAIRLLSVSERQGRWVGVTLPDLLATFPEETNPRNVFAPVTGGIVNLYLPEGTTFGLHLDQGSQLLSERGLIKHEVLTREQYGIGREEERNFCYPTVALLRLIADASTGIG